MRGNSFVTYLLPQVSQRHPVFLAAIFLSMGIIGAYTSDQLLNPNRFLLLSLTAVLSIAMLTFGTRLLWAAVAVIFLVVGWHVTQKELLKTSDFEPSGETVTVQATVAKTWATGPGIRVLLVDSGIDLTTNRHLPGLGRLFVRNDPVELNAGDTVAFRSRIRKPINRGNPGEFDWELDCANNGICWLASVQGEDSLIILRRGVIYNPRAILFRIRERMTRFLDLNSGWFLEEQIRTNVRAVQKGILLGDMGEISPALNKTWADSGIAHALSASGVHIAIVVLLTVFLVKLIVYAAPGILLRVPFKKLCALASAPAILIYCLLVGARVPAMRCAIMGLVVAAAVTWDRKWNSLNSLAVSVVIILLLYPLSLFTPSFQLSFLAAAGIILMVGTAHKRLYGTGTAPAEDPNPEQAIRHDPIHRSLLANATKALALCVLTSIAATLAVTPLIIQYFHSFPVYTVVANLATDLAMTLALSLGLIASVIGSAAPQLGSIILVPADFLVWQINNIASFFSTLPCSTIRQPHMGIPEFILLAGSCWTLIWFIHSPTKRTLFFCAALSCATALALCCSSWLAANRTELKVVFLNVGKGDSIFVKLPASHGWLVDGGVYTDYFDAGHAVVLPFLDWTGATILDGVVMTHPDMDHIGGLLSIVQRTPFRSLFWNPVQANADHLEKIWSVAASMGASVESASRERMPVSMGGATLTFLNQSGQALSKKLPRVRINNASVVCRLDYGETSVLFTGDLERDGEDELMESGLPLKATVLKVAHHGGKTGTTRRFLEAVQPQLAVLSADYPASRGLPNNEVISRLESAGTRILWTGRDGAITLESDGVGPMKIVLGKKPKNAGKPIF